MQKRKIELEFKVYENAQELPSADADLLHAAMNAAKHAYAAFSNFRVGAAGRVHGETEIYVGSNQENASYPVGICAERSLLAAVASKFGSEKIIEAIAISYDNQNPGKNSDIPISPCGMCRQALLQYEHNTRHPIRLILSGKKGKVFVLESAAHLLPLAFTGEELK
jgi:cytidine deaminase